MTDIMHAIGPLCSSVVEAEDGVTTIDLVLESQGLAIAPETRDASHGASEQRLLSRLMYEYLA